VPPFSGALLIQRGWSGGAHCEADILLTVGHSQENVVVVPRKRVLQSSASAQVHGPNHLVRQVAHYIDEKMETQKG
jgi:hypothetical protein